MMSPKTFLESMTELLITIFAVLSLAMPAQTRESRDVADLDLESLLDNVVVSASKHQETLEETPANVYILTRAMIEKYGCRTIGEALALAPGIYITDDHSLTQVGVRGVSSFGDWNSHVMVLIDGRPLNEQYGGSSSIDVSGLDIDNIERIEVIKGPASSLYGSNAFFGLVNLITRQPDGNEVGVSGKYFSGTGNSATSIDLFHRFNSGVQVLITGSAMDQKGNDLYFREFSNPGDSTLLRLDEDGYNQFYLGSSDFSGGWARDKNTLRNFSTHSRIDWRDFSLTLHFAGLETGLAQSAWGSLFQRPENRYAETRHFVDLAYSKQVSDRVEAKARLSYDRYTFTDYILYNYASLETSPSYLPGPIWKDWEYDRSYSTEIRLDVDFSENHRLIAGGESQFHQIRQVSGETGVDRETVVENIIPPANAREDGQIFNLYFQDEYRISPLAKMVAGAHFNYYTYTTGRVMPKGALILTPYRGGTYKLVVSRGFRSPTFYELTYDDGSFYYQNPDLEPELITSYELIVSHDLRYGLVLDVAANTSRIDDMIQLNVVDSTDAGYPGGDYGPQVLQFRNTGKMLTNSVELSVRSNPVYRLSGLANVTWQDVDVQDDQSGRDRVDNSPKWLGNLGINCQLVEDRLSLSAKANYVSSRFLWDGDRLGSTWLVDVMLRAGNLIGGVDLGIGVKNLFDRAYRVPLSFDYAPSTSIGQTGRSVFLTARLATGKY